MPKRLALACAVLVLVTCGGSSAPPPAPPSSPVPPSGPALFFPLEEGRIYNYTTREGDESGMLVARVHRTDPMHGELRMSNATKRFVYTPDGVAYDGGGAYILKAPLKPGASWPGEHGGTTRIVSVDASSKVPAGTYSGCVQTVEEGGRPPGSRYTTTFCPGIGMVLLQVTMGSVEARAELKSYGAPVVIE